MSYVHTVVHRWARSTTATAGQFGTVIKKLRNRRDMPHCFPHKRYMYEYLTEKVGLDPSLVMARDPLSEEKLVIDALWSSYRCFSSNKDPDSEDPEMLQRALAKTTAGRV